MNQDQLYQWSTAISTRFNGLSEPQLKMLANVPVAALRAEHCQLHRLAEFLPGEAKLDSKTARIRDFLANKRLTRKMFYNCWLPMAIEAFAKDADITLIGDETAIGSQYRAMMISLAYDGRAVPLICRVYYAQSSEDYPNEGQVRMIVDMLKQVRRFVPADREVIVQADRGIGNSPALCKAIDKMGWYFCFRIPRNVKLHTEFAKLLPIELAKPGECVSLSGKVFVSRGNIPANVRMWWGEDKAEPWIVITNHPNLCPKDYNKRNWIEQSFRDFKSNGFQLSSSRLRSPDRIERLLMILMIAMGIAIDLGLFARKVAKTARKQRRGKDGAMGWARSVYKEGLRFFKTKLAHRRNLPETDFLMPMRPYGKKT